MRKSSVSTPRRVRCDVANAMISSSNQGNRRTSRQSIASAIGRRSSIHEGKKETRPPNDRQNLQKNLANLAAFLTDNNYTHLGVPFSLNKVLNSPSARDVTCIFQYLISLLGIDYSREKKFEDEFPRIMKLLSYPYVSNKRQLQTIGSTHNWPSTAHALSWLCHYNKTFKAIDDDLLDFPKDGDDDMLKYLEFQVDTKAYNCFLQGVDDHAPMDKDFCDKLPALMGMDEVKELDEKMASLSEKKNQIQKLQEFCDTTRQENIVLETESEKLTTYIYEVEDFARKLDIHISTMTEEGEKTKNKLDSLKEAVREKKNKIASQRITVHEVQALEMVVDNLKSQMTENENVLSKLQGEVFTSDAGLLNEKDQLHAVIEDYHSIARDCNLIPVSACNAQGYDYSVYLPKPESETSASNCDDILRRLKLILKQWKESSRGIKVKEMKSLENVQQLEDIYASKVIEVDYVKAKIRRQQEAIEVVKQEYASEIHKLREEIARMEEAIIRLNQRDKGAYDIEALQMTNKDLRMEVMQLEDKVRDRKMAVDDFLLKFCEIISDHKNAVEERVLRFRDCIVKWCDEREKYVGYDYQKLRQELKIDELNSEVDRIVKNAH